MKKNEMNEMLKIMKNAAIKAGEAILSLKNTPDIKFKGKKYNLVTKADKEAENIIIETIKSNFKNHSILSEESTTETSTDSNNLWIIDPLDGTNNFASKIPHYCISIGYAEKGNVLLGLVYDPERKEMFSAIKGKGAFLNDEKIKVSIKRKINESIIATGFYYDRNEIMEYTLKSIHSLFKNQIRGIRRMGAAALDLCWVACGRYEGYFEYKLHPWDFSAGVLIVEEAKGKCSDKYGKKMKLNSEGIIADNGFINKEFIKIVSVK